jgi:hypothetical protein
MGVCWVHDTLRNARPSPPIATPRGNMGILLDAELSEIMDILKKLTDHCIAAAGFVSINRSGAGCNFQS